VWGGIALAEGETRSDFVYRSSAEIPPRPNASGGAHVVNAYQTERSPGYAEAPGNYAALGGPVVAAPYDDGLETWGPGATARVTQPPPPTGPGSGYIVRGTVPPISPTPSPTVRVQHLGATAATPPVVPDPITAWLSESTIIPGVENMWLAGAAAIAAFFLLRGSK